MKKLRKLARPEGFEPPTPWFVAGDARITDLHVWRVGKQVYSCALTVVTHDSALTPDVVRERLSVHEEIVHSTIEIHHCPDAPTDAVRATA